MIALIIILMYLIFAIPLIVKSARLKTRNPPFREIKKQFIFAIAGVAAVTIFLSLIDFQVNLLWFRSVFFLTPFLKRILYRFVFFVISFLFSYLIYYVAFYVPKRREELELGERIINGLKKYVPLVLALFTGISFSSNFMTVLFFLNRVESQIVDPVFKMPVSFYLFTYPFLSYLFSFLLAIFIVAFVVEEVVYLLYIRPNFSQSSSVNLHATNLLSTIAGLIFLVGACKIYVSVYSLLFEQSGAVFGIGYTDFYVRVPLFKILAAVFVIASIFLFIYAMIPRFTRRTPVIRVIIVGVIAVVLLYQLIPSAFQFLIVRPTELSREKRFLSYNIQGTREAYALDKFESTQVGDVTNITKEIVEREHTIIDNLRFWDWRALRDTYQQIQSIRLYYTFSDVDVDRYSVDGKLKEVMVGARELDTRLLPENSRTWVNIHLKYTHGYGLCMNTVNEFTTEGLPNLLIKDIPPVSSIPGLAVKQPEVYFGELTNNYVFVNTLTEEFDYPKGEENAYTTYRENRGVPMTPLNRLIFAISFNDPNIILSRYLTSDSRLLFIRNISQRMAKIAPYFEYGRDPYVVLGDDGKLYFMGDAYSYSSYYPYSERVSFYGRNINYLRNPVKYVVDAYTGDVSFYIIDPTDPIVSVLSRIFPEMFKQYSEMPEFLKSHLRYPDEYLQMQGYVYLNYHMSDPEVFYNKEDRWAIAQEKYYDSTQEVIPYFAIVKDKESGNYTFANIYSFTPYRKSNLVALVIAYCDKDNYGRVQVMRFPKDKLIFGPLQIEARVDQDSEISKVLTLWNQQGSEVIRGNLLVMPIDNSILYLEPVYLQANTAKFPQIKKVVLASQDKLVWGDTFEDAIKMLLGESVETPTTEDKTVAELISQAQDHFEKYKQYVSEGNYEQAGKELRQIEEIIKKIQEIETKP